MFKNNSIMSVKDHLISDAEFKSMKDSFDKTIKKKISQQLTESVWFPFEDLKEFFKLVEKHATDHNTKVSGIRFNMVAQTKNKKRLTLALTPTFGKTGPVVDSSLSKTDESIALRSVEDDSVKEGTNGLIFNKGTKRP